MDTPLREWSAGSHDKFRVDGSVGSIQVVGAENPMIVGRCMLIILPGEGAVSARVRSKPHFLSSASATISLAPADVQSSITVRNCLPAGGKRCWQSCSLRTATQAQNQPGCASDVERFAPRRTISCAGSSSLAHADTPPVARIVTLSPPFWLTQLTQPLTPVCQIVRLPAHLMSVPRRPV